jgi:hypothetical protein
MAYEVPRRAEVIIYTGAVSPAEKIVAAGVLAVPANSGGIILSSGEVVSVTIKASAKNSGDIYIGGPDARPYSGYGYCLEPGEVVSLDVQNLSNIALVAVVSGDIVTWAGLK